MPYNPGIVSNGGEAIGRGIAQGGSRWLEALQWITNQADETKQLRTTLDTVDPSGKDAHKEMSSGELKGKIAGLHMQDQAKSAALNDALKSAQLSGLQDQATSETAMTSAMRQAMPAASTNDLDASGRPLAPGTAVANARARQMQPGDLMKAIAANPQAINSPAGRQAMNDWMRQAMTAQRGPPQFTTGPDGSTWASNPSTGIFEPSPLDKIKATAAAKAAAQPPTREPGKGPTLSRDKAFYWDEHLQAWKPRAAGLFGGADQTDETDSGLTSYTRDKNGNLIRGGQ